MYLVPGVYISYPFCSQKCSFCNFASGVGTPGSVARYEHALLEELRAHNWQWLPDTLYLGGGTPSLMSSDLLCKLTSLIPNERLREATIECAPGTITKEGLLVWRSCGINRVSFGVQSFVNAELRQTGRRHTAETVRAEAALLRELSLNNINYDLIAGLPGQTRESWEISLDWIARLEPSHVSVYLFETDEDSRLGNELLLGGTRYGAPQMPADDLMAELYERAVERLAALGWRRYEISNFARRGYESRHNLKYWRLEPYCGFGLDAHSFDGKQRSSNPDTLEAYLTQSGQSPSPTDASEEHFFVGLRLMDGIQPTSEEWIRFAQPIEKWLAAGMLERAGPHLRLSSSGVLVSNEIFQEFLA
ncbi:MAG TPA: coproporphyrinogen-III oxidase family protein [Bryobacteraceae bacterium]|jgi:oxygen-independent coproporphyrinogen-3 oxidase